MILVFTGAGASAAISPEKYPTTVDFFKSHLSAKIKKDLESVVQGSLASYLPMIADEIQEHLDIEFVLGIIDELRKDFERIAEPITPIGHTLSNVAPNIDRQALSFAMI